MRRSLNSNKSVLLIIMVAVFTLISYFFDQMVIRQEDTLRNNQIKLENLNVKIDTLTSVSEQLLTLQESVWIKYITLKRQRNFWFKSLLILTNYDSYPFLTNKELQATFDDKKFIDQYIKGKFIRYFRDTIVAHYEIDDSFYNIVSPHTDDLFPEFLISENNQNRRRFDLIDALCSSILYSAVRASIFLVAIAKLDMNLSSIAPLSSLWESKTFNCWKVKISGFIRRASHGSLL